VPPPPELLALPPPPICIIIAASRPIRMLQPALIGVSTPPNKPLRKNSGSTEFFSGHRWMVRSTPEVALRIASGGEKPLLQSTGIHVSI
jgi:hypothetical protein